MVGIGRESATRALQGLQQDRIILLQDRMITITNIKELYSLAGGKDVPETRKWHSYYSYKV
ncbi:hypothetical protein D3C78_1593430 [compost metagenome]